MLKITNCLNCGAPLSGSICQYCGMDYGERAPMSITIDDDSLRGTLVFKGCSFAVYLREIEMGQSYPTITFTLDGYPADKEG